MAKSKKKPTHSPLPWSILVHDHHLELVDAAGNPIVWGEGDDMAHEVWANEGDIPLIVDAVNALHQAKTKK